MRMRCFERFGALLLLVVPWVSAFYPTPHHTDIPHMAIAPSGDAVKDAARQMALVDVDGDGKANEKEIKHYIRLGDACGAFVLLTHDEHQRITPERIRRKFSTRRSVGM